MDILKRILKEKKLKGLSWNKLAETLPINGDSLRIAFSRKSVDETYIELICEVLGLKYEQNEQEPEGRIINDEDYPEKEVIVIPIKGRGGLENTYFDEVKFRDLKTEKLTIKEPSSNGSKWFKIEVEGISMDDGSKKSLSEGDWAYCRSISKQYWKSKLHSHKWDIFCFFHNERGIIFKKIKEQDIETGELILESLHPDKNQFSDFKIKVSECSYICNVIKVLSEF